MHTGLKAQNVNAKQKILKQHSMVQVVTSGETHTSTKISLKDKCQDQDSQDLGARERSYYSR